MLKAGKNATHVCKRIAAGGVGAASRASTALSYRVGSLRSGLMLGPRDACGVSALNAPDAGVEPVGRDDPSDNIR